jgi:hypothetical protein
VTGSFTICLEAGLQRSASYSLGINSCDLDSDLKRRRFLSISKGVTRTFMLPHMFLAQARSRNESIEKFRRLVDYRVHLIVSGESYSSVSPIRNPRSASMLESERLGRLLISQGHCSEIPRRRFGENRPLELGLARSHTGEGVSKQVESRTGPEGPDSVFKTQYSCSQVSSIQLECFGKETD